MGLGRLGGVTWETAGVSDREGCKEGSELVIRMGGVGRDRGKRDGRCHDAEKRRARDRSPVSRGGREHIWKFILASAKYYL